MAEMTEERLAEIEGRVGNTTPGPWRVERYFDDEPYDDGEVFTYVVEAGLHCGRDHEMAMIDEPSDTDLANLDFLAAARQDVPDLIAALRAEREARRAALAMLLEQEWITEQDGTYWCQTCSWQRSRDHTADCFYGNLIRRLQEVDRE